MMRLLLVLTTLSYLPALSLGKSVGSIQIEGYGDIFLLAPDWAAPSIEVLDNGFTLNGPSRLYLGSSPDDSFTADSFWQVPLMGKHFSYTVDLSNVECGCNAGNYFLNMPGDPNNAGDYGDYYCDANNVGGMWCPEYDTMEANKYTMASTIHTCDRNADGVTWDSCDRGGCQVNAYNIDPDLMCPDERCTINTQRPFQTTHFQSAEKVTTTLEQDGKSGSFSVCNQGQYVADMSPSFQGMVFCATMWGGGGIDMSWLDGMTGCNEAACNIGTTTVTFTNFQLKA
jgi:hypothetical protein